MFIQGCNTLGLAGRSHLVSMGLHYFRRGDQRELPDALAPMGSRGLEFSKPHLNPGQEQPGQLGAQSCFQCRWQCQGFEDAVFGLAKMSVSLFYARQANQGFEAFISHDTAVTESQNTQGQRPRFVKSVECQQAVSKIAT